MQTLSPFETRLLHIATVAIGVTGLAYGWMKYFVEPADEFSIIGHPWQPHMQHWHILLAPLLIFGCGLIWKSHIWFKINCGAPARRVTGIALTVLLLPMVISGYALQVSNGETMRSFWIWTHGSSSVLWLVLYLAHQLRPASSE
ncbi:MAG: hypothetical protein ACI841_000190 [Planctomycetota bacterium]|jgi:hypothetical protein